MRPVELGQPVGGNDMAWMQGALREIERASNLDDPFTTFDQAIITVPPGFVPVRTLDVATATVGDLAAFVATLVLDMQSRGPGRVE